MLMISSQTMQRKAVYNGNGLLKAIQRSIYATCHASSLVWGKCKEHGETFSGHVLILHDMHPDQGMRII
jgi:hypothetical protein